MIVGSECSYLISESPRLYCGAPTVWVQYDKAGRQPLNVLCDAHRTKGSVPIPHDAPRAAASEYFLKR